MKYLPFHAALVCLFAAIAIAFAMALSSCVTDPQLESPPVDSAATAKTAAPDTSSPAPETYPDIKPPSPKR